MIDLNTVLEERSIEAGQQRVPFAPARVFVSSGFALVLSWRVVFQAMAYGIHQLATRPDGISGAVRNTQIKAISFKPVHAVQLYRRYPGPKRLLGLSPGYRFVSAGGSLDI